MTSEPPEQHEPEEYELHWTEIPEDKIHWFSEIETVSTKPTWRKIVRFSLLAALLIGLLVWAGHAQADHWTLDKMNKVVNQTNFVVDGGCSGTLIDTRLVLTNHHCVRWKITAVEKEEVDSKGNVKKVKKLRLLDVPLEQHSYADHRRVASASYQSEIVAFQQDKDLALLRIRAEELPFTQVAQLLPDGVSLHRGESVWVVGNPAGLDATILNGIISSKNRMFRVPWANNEEVPFLQVSGGIFGGNSGGALFNAHGYFIGVPAAAIRGSNLGFVIPIKTVKEFLKKNCYQSLWMDGEPDHEACMKARKEEEKKKDHASLYNLTYPAGVAPSCDNATFMWNRRLVHQLGFDATGC